MFVFLFVNALCTAAALEDGSLISFSFHFELTLSLLSLITHSIRPFAISPIAVLMALWRR